MGPMTGMGAASGVVDRPERMVTQMPNVYAVPASVHSVMCTKDELHR